MDRLPYELGAFYACFDLLIKDSAVKSTLPPDSWPLSPYRMRKILLRVNINKAADPHPIPIYVLKAS